ncbi:MAG: methylmalonyl-CoA mutase family protein [Planctomycetota bacterium]
MSAPTDARLEEALASWRAAAEKGLRGATFEEALVQERFPGMAVPPLATAADLPGGTGALAGVDRLGALPDRRLQGAPAWFLAPRLDLADPREANRVALGELQGGADALWLPFDAAARLGLDPRTPAGAEAWGDGGLMAYDLEAWREMTEGVHLEMVQLLLDTGGQPLPNLAPLMALVEERGLDREALAWNLGADPFGSLAGGFFSGGRRWQQEQVRELLRWTPKNLPRARAFCLSAEPFHLGGATLAESLGLLAANLVQLLRLAEQIGFTPRELAQQVAFRLPMGRDLFLHAAGMRALRLLWRRLLESCGVADPPPAWIHAIGSRRTLSRRDPWSNLLRATTQTMAAALGGAEAVTVCSFDEALGKPGRLGRRVARNTALVMSEECGLGDVHDPLGGSYWAESATARLAELAWGVMQEVEREGGIANALGKGWVQDRLAASWERRRRDFAEGRQAIVGVTRFAMEDEDVPQGEERIGPAEAEALERWRARAADGETPESLPVQGDAEEVDLDALTRLAAIGGDVFGLAASARFFCRDGRTLAPMAAIAVHRDSEDFEALSEPDSAPEVTG